MFRNLTELYPKKNHLLNLIEIKQVLKKHRYTEIN